MIHTYLPPTYHLFDARTPRSRTRHRRTRVWPRVRVAATAAMLKADLYIIDRARPRLDGFRHAIRHGTYARYICGTTVGARARVTRSPAANKTRWFTHRQPHWGNRGSHVFSLAYMYVPITAVSENVLLLEEYAEGWRGASKAVSRTPFPSTVFTNYSTCNFIYNIPGAKVIISIRLIQFNLISLVVLFFFLTTIERTRRTPLTVVNLRATN